MVEPEPLVVLAIVDALLVALFFLFRVLPWSRPGPWRAIWIIASLTSVLFIAAELVALTAQGSALSAEHQIPLFGAIFAVTAGFILTYLGGMRVTDRAVTMAETDPLTGIGNARAFDLRLADLTRRHQPFALVYLDLDKFKRINDEFGHAAGDEVLKTVAQILRGCIREGDLPARLGGDEFAVLLTAADGAAARQAAARILDGVQAEAAQRDPDRRFSASIGVVSAAEKLTSTAAVRAADAAMYRSKSAGGGQITVAEA